MFFRLGWLLSRWWILVTTQMSKKIILQLNIKRSQSVHMAFVICLYNLGDRESEKTKTPMCTSLFL